MTSGSAHQVAPARPAGRGARRRPSWASAGSGPLAIQGSLAIQGPLAIQGTFDELGTLLREATFVVVDLETTGGSPLGGSSITEIGAVKVRGGVVLGEFQTLVRPSDEIPPFISVLTGITNQMVATAPGIGSVLPAFLEFARGSVLVAHNAPFDVGFLRHFADRLDIPWPGFDVLDTATMARRLVTRDDAPDCKLSSLARLFHASTTPNHRALSDARATVDVLHGLVERLGNLGVRTVEELHTFSSRVTAAQRRKRHLAEHLPGGPGVYLFRGPRDEVLYVGTSRDVRTRVRSYFTASETRSRMGEMVGLASRVDAVSCATTLEAAIRELRLIAEHKPRYNRRSKFPERMTWVKLTAEPWPRLSIVSKLTDPEADYLGPFGSRKAAGDAMAALHEHFPIRQCAGRLPKHPTASPCALAEMKACVSPCDGSVAPEVYAVLVARVRESVSAAPGEVVATMRAKIERLANGERYEEATVHRERLASFVRGAVRTQRLAMLAACPEIVAAKRNDDQLWEVHVVRFGRLAGAGIIPPGADARSWTDDLRAASETVAPALDGTEGPLTTTEESEKLLAWLEQPGIRLVHIDGEWSCPIRGAESCRDLAETLAESREAARRALVPFDQPRQSRTLSRPAR